MGGGAEGFLETAVKLAGESFLLSVAPAGLRAGPAARLAAPGEGLRGGRGGSRRLRQSATPTGEQFVSALPPVCPRDADDCVFECIAAGFETEVFGPAVVFVSAYEGSACDCSKVFPAVAGASTEQAFMIGKVSRAVAGHDGVAFAWSASSVPRLRESGLQFFACLVPVFVDNGAHALDAGGCLP